MSIKEMNPPIPAPKFTTSLSRFPDENDFPYRVREGDQCKWGRYDFAISTGTTVGMTRFDLERFVDRALDLMRRDDDRVAKRLCEDLKIK